MPTPQEIKAAREKAGLTQQQMSEMVFCSKSVVEKWESGERNMPKNAWKLFQISLILRT